MKTGEISDKDVRPSAFKGKVKKWTVHGFMLALSPKPKIWSFYIVRQRNVLKCVRNVLHDYFSIFQPMIIGSLSNDNGDGNENVISKYKFALF